MSNVRLLLDFQNLAIRCLYADMEFVADPNPDYRLLSHRIMTSIIYNIRMFSPNELILAVDGRYYWRKKVYEKYKAQRKAKRDNDVFDWNVFFEYLNSFLSDIKQSLPFKVMKIKWVEADDIIGTLTRLLPDGKTNIIVSSDKDFIQLLSNPKVRLYDPIKREQVKSTDPKRVLEIKILTGDKSDNIPNVKPRLGLKTAIKILDDPELIEKLMKDFYVIPKNILTVEKCTHKWKDDKHNEEENMMVCKKCSLGGKKILIKDTYARNSRLIDMGKIPNKIKHRILELYHAYEVHEITGMDFMRFCVRHNLRRLNEDTNKIIKNFMPLMSAESKNEMEEFF